MIALPSRAPAEVPPVPSPAPTVCAVIPARDRWPELTRCLASLGRLEVEVVVVDDASSDGTAAAVAARFPRVRVLRLERNVGAAQAKNLGAATTGADLLWFLDSDTEIPTTFDLTKAVRLATGEGRVGAVGGELHPLPDGVLEHRVKHLLPNFQTRTVSLPGSYGCVREVDYLPTCNLLIRRALFERVGGFDPVYFILSEDVDLCLRIRGRGLRCVASDPTAVLHHISLRQRPGDLALVHRNRVRLALLFGAPWALLGLPLADLALQAHPALVRSVLRGEISARKHLPEALRERPTRRRDLPRMAAGALAVNARGLASAYAWNLRHLPETLHTRHARAATERVSP
ncbi:MAG: glycosyltransferase [Pseudomonadota bacterium]